MSESFINDIINEKTAATKFYFGEQETVLVITPEPKPFEWDYNVPPPIKYSLNIDFKSVLYVCLKVIDEKNFVVLDPYSNEIIKLSGRAFFV